MQNKSPSTTCQESDKNSRIPSYIPTFESETHVASYVRE